MTFKDIIGYEGLYSISEDGVITNYFYKKVPFEMSTHKTERGFERVHLRKEGKLKTFLLHRLLAIHFLPNPQGHKIINHKDGDKRNNVLDNLEWCTQSDNGKRNYASGVISQPKSDMAFRARKVVCVERNIIFGTVNEAAKWVGRCTASVISACKGRAKTCGGFTWKYAKKTRS